MVVCLDSKGEMEFQWTSPFTFMVLRDAKNPLAMCDRIVGLLSLHNFKQMQWNGIRRLVSVGSIVQLVQLWCQSLFVWNRFGTCFRTQHASERSMFHAGKIVGATFHALGPNSTCCVNLCEQMFSGVETQTHFLWTICLKYRLRGKKHKTVSFFWCVRMECVFAIELAKTTCFHQLSVDDWSKSTFSWCIAGSQAEHGGDNQGMIWQFRFSQQFPICVQHLVQVAVRVRPLIQREIDAGVGLLEFSCTLDLKFHSNCYVDSWMVFLSKYNRRIHYWHKLNTFKCPGYHSGGHSPQCPALGRYDSTMFADPISGWNSANSKHCQAVSVNHAGQRRTFGYTAWFQWTSWQRNPDDFMFCLNNAV